MTDFMQRALRVHRLLVLGGIEEARADELVLRSRDAITQAEDVDTFAQELLRDGTAPTPGAQGEARRDPSASSVDQSIKRNRAASTASNVLRPARKA